MTAASSRSKVRKGVLDGISDAYRKYLRMSGHQLREAPEFFLASSIANKLRKVAAPCKVTLESGIKETLGEARASGKGRAAKTVSYKGRFDIVLWYRVKDKPRAVIEVKHPIRVPTAAKINKDVERICRVLRKSIDNGGSIKLGIFAFYTDSLEPKKKDKNASARLRRRTKIIESRCKAIAKRFRCIARLTMSRAHRFDKEAWASCAVTFTPGVRSKFA